jgi:hypothetical protein
MPQRGIHGSQQINVDRAIALKIEYAANTTHSVRFALVSVSFLEAKGSELVQDKPKKNDVHAACKKEHDAAGKLVKEDKVPDGQTYPEYHHGKSDREEDLVGIGHGDDAKNKLKESEPIPEWSELALRVPVPAFNSNVNKINIISGHNEAHGAGGREGEPIRIQMHESDGSVVTEGPQPGCEICNTLFHEK